MPNNDARTLLPGWETVRQIRCSGRENVYEIAREVGNATERAMLTWISIPMPRPDPWSDSSRRDAEAGRIGPFSQEMRACARELALVREMSADPSVLACRQALLVQKDEGYGWDAFIRTELLPPLSTLAAGGLTEAQILRLGTTVCQALLAGRRNGLIHRGVSPANIYLTEQGGFKLGGFGMASLQEKSGGRVGQPEYVAPEVYRGEPASHSADICSLGLVLYWLLNDCRAPFLPPAPFGEEEMKQAARRRFQGEPLPPPAHGSEALKRVVMKACAFDPRKRYTDADALLQDLQMLAGGGDPLAASAPGAVEETRQAVPAAARRYAPAAAAPAEAAPAAPAKKKLSKKLPLLIGAPAAALLLVLLLIPKGAKTAKAPEVSQEPAESTLLETATPAPTVLPVEEPSAMLPPEPTPEPTPEQHQTAESTPTPEPTPEPTPAPTPEPTQEPSPDLTTTSDTEGYEEMENGFSWKLKEGTLYIKGEGELKDLETVPWAEQQETIERIELLGDVTAIGEGLFENTVSLTELVLPEGLTAIGDSAFCGCTALRSVELPESLERIGESAFEDCIALGAVVLPSGPIEIGESAFESCSALETVTVAKSAPFLGKQSAVGGMETTLVPRAEVTGAVGKQAFRSCLLLKTVELPEGVTVIGKKAFENCGMLESIRLPKSLNTVERDAFNTCIMLRDVFYSGDENQWKDIDFTSGNDILESTTIHYSVS